MDSLEAKFRIRVDGKDELADFFSGGERGAKSMQSAIGRALGDTARDIKSFTLGIGRDLLAVSGMKLGIAANAKHALEFRDSLQQLVIMAQIGDDKIGGLKDQILATAKASNQFETDVTSALSSFVEKTGDIETARKNLALYGMTATATGTAIEDIANVGVELSRKLNVKDQAAAFGILAVQAKVGAVELRNLATAAPKIFSAGAAMGLTGEKGVREAGALAQVYVQAFGGKGQGASTNATTAVERTFLDLAANRTQIERLGINVRDRDPLDVIFDIIRKTGGDRNALVDTKIFDSRALRGVTILANEFKRTGKFGTYESFRDVQPDVNLLPNDAKRAMSTGIAALKAQQIAIDTSSERNLGNGADWLAHHANLISASYDAVTSHPLVAGGAGIAGAFGLNLLKNKAFGKGGLGGGGIFSGGGPTPVTVTNWPASMGGTGGAPGGGRGVLGTALATGIPLIGAGLAADTAVKGLLGGVSVGGGLKWGDITNDNGYANKGSIREGILRQKVGLFNAMLDENAAKQAAANPNGPAPVVVHLKVENHGDKATVVNEDTGTRSPAAMAQRTGGGD